MNATVLAGPPVSGSIAERHFNAVGDCTWVRFDQEDGDEWVGAFRNAGLVAGNIVLSFSDGRTVLVGAGGQGYVIDLVARDLLYEPDVVPVVGGSSVPSRDFVVVHDFTDLYCLGRTKELWRSGRVALDGIELLEVTGETLHGRARQHDGWYPFTLAYDGWVFEKRLGNGGGGGAHV